MKTVYIDPVTAVQVAGEVDLYSSPQLRKILVALTEKRTTPILVDLAEVRYLDSSGLATLIEGLKQCQRYKGRFMLSGISEEVKQVFELTRLVNVFEIHATVAAAVESVSK
ncbi:STAS domain-containing protein [candidate division KSB1 bacterium]|nr:STAS domain-containing protein [candidate division KSB1 bacterium]